MLLPVIASEAKQAELLLKLWQMRLLRFARNDGNVQVILNPSVTPFG